MNYWCFKLKPFYHFIFTLMVLAQNVSNLFHYHIFIGSLLFLPFLFHNAYTCICTAYQFVMHIYILYMYFIIWTLICMYFYKLVILHFKIIGMTIEIIYTKYSYSKYCVPYMYVHLHSNNPNHNLCQVLCIIIHFDF